MRSLVVTALVFISLFLAIAVAVLAIALLRSTSRQAPGKDDEEVER